MVWCRRMMERDVAAVSIDIDVSKRCQIKRELVPGSATAFVLVATNHWPLSVRLVVSLTGSNLVAAVKGEQVAAGDTIDIRDIECHCKPDARRILLRLSYFDASKKVTLSWTANMRFDVLPESIDTTFLYARPVDDQWPVSQGNTCGSHMLLQSRYAFDFECPIGTEITAARSGVVFSAVDEYDTNDPHPQHANRLLIVHSDESVAVYGHLAQRGVLVAVDQFVEQGTVIAISGNSGKSTGPHLHFHVARPTADHGWVGIELAFRES